MPLNQVERYLLHWAEWQAKDNQNGLGYPSSAIITQVVSRHKTAYRQPLAVDELAEQVDQWIAAMRRFKLELAAVICAHYLDPGLMPQKAAQLNISCPQFKQQLRLARYWLAGRISAECKRAAV